MALKDLFKKSDKTKQEDTKAKEENLGVQFDIDETKRKEIVRTIQTMRDDFENSRSEFMGIREECVKQYEGIKKNSDIPWPDHSNISTMVTTVACDLLHSKLFGMSWNAKSIYWEGTEENDAAVAEMNKIVMAYVVSTEMKMQNDIDDLVHMLVIDGTVCVKKVWKPYYKWVKHLRMKQDITPNMLITGKPEYEAQYDYMRFEKCFIELRPLEHVYFAYDANSQLPNWEDEADIIDERWYTLAQLKEMQKQGVIAQNIKFEDFKGSMDSLPEFKGTSKERMSSEGSVEANTRKENYKLRCLEAEIMYDINKDGVREKCVFFVCDSLSLYLSGKPITAVSRIGRSSWLIRPFLRRPGRVYGKSVPELVRHLHKELDDIHNGRIDAMNIRIAPFFFYRPASGVNPRRIVVGPATGVPLDDPARDVYFPTLPGGNLAISFQEEKLVFDLIERLTYLTPAMLGRETAERPTARGTLAVIQQGEQKFGILGARVQNIICDLITDIRQKYEENMPPEKWERILGKERLRDFPSVEYMIGNYEAKMQLDLTASDPDADRQLAVAVFQTMALDPMVAQNPAFMWEVRADYLKALRRTPVEKYIGPKPQTTVSSKDAEDLFAMCQQEFMFRASELAGVDPATAIPELMKLKDSARYEQFTPEAKVVFMDLLRKLQSLYQDKIQKLQEQAMQAQGGQGGGNTPATGVPGGIGQAPGMGRPNMGSPGPSMGAGAPQGPMVPGSPEQPQ